MKQLYLDRMNITGKVCVVTGGSGLLGRRHAEAILEGGGVPVLLARSAAGMEKVRDILVEEYGEDVTVEMKAADITDKAAPVIYVCTILYMISDAAKYMTGATVVLDGGRTIW